MIRIIAQITWNTFREILRQPVYLLILLAVLTLIGMLPMMTLFVFREQEKMVTDSALAAVMVFGWVLAVLCSASAITREIDRGTAITVLAKPVPRLSFIIGKILGVLLALLIFWFLTSMASLISIRAATDQFRFDQAVVLVCFGAIGLSCLFGGLRNYVSKASFSMNAALALLALYPVAMATVALMGAEEGYTLTYAWNTVPAFVLILYAIWIMGGLAIALSTRFSLLVNLHICAVVFVIGLMSDYFLGRHTETSVLARVAYAAVPNWQLLWLADALAAERVIPMAYLALGGLYTLAMMGVFITLAMALFYNREVGLQNIR